MEKKKLLKPILNLKFNFEEQEDFPGLDVKAKFPAKSIKKKIKIVKITKHKKDSSTNKLF